MRENPTQLTVFPETAIPAFLHQLPPGYLDILRALALRTNGDLLLGVATGGLSVLDNESGAFRPVAQADHANVLAEPRF